MHKNMFQPIPGLIMHVCACACMCACCMCVHVRMCVCQYMCALLWHHQVGWYRGWLIALFNTYTCMHIHAMLKNSTTQYYTLHNITQCYTILHITQYYALLHNITQYYALLHNITQYYTTLHNITQCYTILHYITQYSSPSRPSSVVVLHHLTKGHWPKLREKLS